MRTSEAYLTLFLFSSSCPVLGGIIIGVRSQENGRKIIVGKNSAVRVTSSFLQCDSSGAWSLISVVEGGWRGRDQEEMESCYDCVVLCDQSGKNR